jgi:hypothetical protein
MQTIVGDPSAFLAAGDEYHSLVPEVSTPSLLNYKLFQQSYRVKYLKFDQIYR